MLRFVIFALTLMSSACCARADDASGTITILEGGALVYRASGRMYALEGLRLAAGDIVETAAKAFAQIEMSDRSVVQLGPATRMMISTTTTRGKQERLVYFLEGWGKVSNAKAESSPLSGFDIRAPLFEVAASPGVIVFQSAPAQVTMFVERGDMRITERGGTPSVVSLKSGDYYRRNAGARGAANPPEARAFIGEMPRQFLDTLPARMERFRDREVKAKEAPAMAYADVEPWLKAEPAIRRQFVQRWRSKARDKAFRSALIANLSAHPEWDPILFPEKYLPKAPPPIVAVPSSPPVNQSNPPPAR